MMRMISKHRTLRLTAGFAALLGMFVLGGCGSDDDTEEPDGVECSGHGVLTGGECVCDDGYMQDAADPTTCVVDDVIHGDGVATDLNLHLHANAVKIVLSTMTVVGQEATEWDLWMAHDDPVDGGPSLHLGDGVTGQSLGSGSAYHDVAEAPADGYQADDAAAEQYVIGSSWRAGGEGSTGFIMSENVYVVKLADETYGKVEVLSAQSGEVHVLCYRQPDGTLDISTNAP